jgi:hypothetical protein
MTGAIFQTNEAYFDNTYVECFGDAECEKLTATSRWVISPSVWNSTDMEFGATISPSESDLVQSNITDPAQFFKVEYEDFFHPEKSRLWVLGGICRMFCFLPGRPSLIRSGFLDPVWTVGGASSVPGQVKSEFGWMRRVVPSWRGSGSGVGMKKGGIPL